LRKSEIKGRGFAGILREKGARDEAGKRRTERIFVLGSGAVFEWKLEIWTTFGQA
jgi:hypothetical protein